MTEKELRGPAIGILFALIGLAIQITGLKSSPGGKG